MAEGILKLRQRTKAMQGLKRTKNFFFPSQCLRCGLFSSVFQMRTSPKNTFMRSIHYNSRAREYHLKHSMATYSKRIDSVLYSEICSRGSSSG